MCDLLLIDFGQTLWVLIKALLIFGAFSDIAPLVADWHVLLI